MTVNKWIEENYQNILQWSKNACQGNEDWEDVAHYAITSFLENERAAELVERGHARWFIVRILLNSSRGTKSEYYRLYRPLHVSLDHFGDTPTVEYDNDIDLLTEVISGILEDMRNGDSHEWYEATIFELCQQQKKLNFSKLARETGIPRTSIAAAYKNTIEFIKIKLEEYGKLDQHLRNSLISYLSDAN